MIDEAVTDQRIQRAYWRFVNSQELPASVQMRVAFIAGWRAGGANALRSTSQLAELVPTLRELIQWLEDEDEQSL